MSDFTSLATGPGENPAERAAREEQHQVLIELLGAYADRELPPETTSQIDAHLVGCARCRRELAVHQAVRRRLGVEPPLAAPPALRERIAAAVAATPVPVAPPQPAGAVQRRWRLSRYPWLFMIALLLAAALATGAIVSWHAGRESPAVEQLSTAPSAVPLLRDVLLDYRRVTAGDLPGRARDLDLVRGAVPFTFEPLRAPELRLLAAWTTDVQGEAAAVLAYRWDDRIVLEYIVPEGLFFQHPAIRAAVAGGRLLATSDGPRGVVAWPSDAAGTVLVGDISPRQLARLPAAALARRVSRGAQ